MQNFIDKDDFHIIPKRKVIGITFGVRDYYYRFTNKVIGLNRFGLSAKGDVLLDYFGFTEEKLTEEIKKIIGDSYE